MKVLLFCGSLRKDSLNLKLLKCAKKIVETNSSFTSNLLDFNTLNIPLYSGDIESAGIPAGVSKLGEEILQADYIIISSPEYNRTISGVLKNTLDWVSRLPSNPLAKKKVFLMGASPGKYGALRGIDNGKMVMRALEADLSPAEFALSGANKAFDEAGNLNSEDNKKAFEKTMKAFLGFN